MTASGRWSGRDPVVIGVHPGREPGLVVGDGLANWPDLTAAGNGVVVGASTATSPPGSGPF